MAVNDPVYPSSPPYWDESLPPAERLTPVEPIERASPLGAAQVSEPFPMRIIGLPMLGAFAICVVIVIIGIVVLSQAFEPTGTDGDGLAFVALTLLTFVMLWPASFAALLVSAMRRDGRTTSTLLGIITGSGIAPALVIGSISIVYFTQNRGLRITGLVAALVFVVLAITWILVAMDRQPVRTGVLGAVVGVIVLVFTVTAASLNADAHDRALERQAIAELNAPLALFDMRGALSERDGWRITQVDTIHVDRSRQYGSLGLDLENDSGLRINVRFSSTKAGGHCDLAVICQPLLTLDDGTIIHGDPGAVGTHFDFPAARSQGWWVLYTSTGMTANELSEVAELLHPVTVDAWIGAQSRFGN